MIVCPQFIFRYPMWTAKVLVRLGKCTGSSESWLLAYVRWKRNVFFSLKEDRTYFAKLFSFPTRLVSSADNFCKHFGPRSKMSGLILIQSVWQHDGFPERLFWMCWFWKVKTHTENSCIMQCLQYKEILHNFLFCIFAGGLEAIIHVVW